MPTTNHVKHDIAHYRDRLDLAERSLPFAENLATAHDVTLYLSTVDFKLTLAPSSQEKLTALLAELPPTPEPRTFVVNDVVHSLYDYPELTVLYTTEDSP